MKVSDIQVGKPDVIELCPILLADFGRAIKKEIEVRLDWDNHNSEAILFDGESTWSVKGVSKHDDFSLSELFRRALPRLCYIATIHPRQGRTLRLTVHVLSFAEAYSEPNEVHIGVSDKVIEWLDENRLLESKAKNKASEAIRWLTENTIVEAISLPPLRLLISGSRTPGSLVEPGFRVYGNGVAVDVKRTSEGVWDVQRVVHGISVPPDDEHAIVMLQGLIKYVDASVAAQVRGIDPTRLDSLVRQSSGYLSLWQRYNELEREIIYRRARQVGWLKYKSCIALPDGQWRFNVDNDDDSQEVLERLLDGEETDLEVSRELPERLHNAELDEMSESAVDEYFGRNLVFTGQCRHVDIEGRTIDLRPIDPDRVQSPAEKGYIYVALSGDEIRLKRRLDARQRIQSLSGPMPQIALLLEGLDAPVGKHRPVHVKPDVLSNLIGGRPTSQQVEALKVALNTPDIALIQGPPGTGKTRVIAALQSLLAEDDASRGAGQILLTSYQHDAVETVADRTRVLGLPAIRVGGRHGHATTGHDKVDAWCRECITEIRSRLDALPQHPISQVLRDVRELAKAYIMNPGNSSTAIDVLEQIYDRCDTHISPDLSDLLLFLIQRVRMSNTPHLGIAPEDRISLLRSARGLRTEPISFADDGSENARRMFWKLERSHSIISVTSEDLEILRLTADQTAEPTSQLLNQIQTVQNKLIDALIKTSEIERAPMLNADVERLLTCVVDELHKKSMEALDGVDDALFEFVRDLENDPNGVREAIKSYSLVLAATCQQSVNNDMLRHKDNDNNFGFTTVIVDEAARANPLDLFIPMARARRRIILVGDHRQLPHILEQDVERGLEASGEDAQDRLNESLFERLFSHLSTLERTKGAVKRTVTLDTQFRMHRALGAFVSRVFYEPHGEGFKSIRPDSDFAHGIDRYVGKVAAWVDIPHNRDGGEKSGHSKSRRKEAEWAVKEARRILESTPHFSVGIITFYTSQEKEIQRALVNKDMAQDGEEGFVLFPQWRSGKDQQERSIERLRVGTVDSFQGKEFDVVILSMTRSNNHPARNDIDARRKYGFLTLENRLCVAMSRQKRLLIVVGDAAMVTNDAAASAVPGLCAFYKLCGEEYGIRLSA